MLLNAAFRHFRGDLECPVIFRQRFHLVQSKNPLRDLAAFHRLRDPDFFLRGQKLHFADLFQIHADRILDIDNVAPVGKAVLLRFRLFALALLNRGQLACRGVIIVIVVQKVGRIIIIRTLRVDLNSLLLEEIRYAVHIVVAQRTLCESRIDVFLIDHVVVFLREL